MIIISPEGTRKEVKEWKTGFYYIALEAGVPIFLGNLDYKQPLVESRTAYADNFYHVQPNGSYDEEFEQSDDSDGDGFIDTVKKAFEENGLIGKTIGVNSTERAW